MTYDVKYSTVLDSACCISTSHPLSIAKPVTALGSTTIVYTAQQAGEFVKQGAGSWEKAEVRGVEGW